MWVLIGVGLLFGALMTTAAVFEVRQTRAAMDRRRWLGLVTGVAPDLDGKIVVLEGRLVSTERVMRFEDATRVLATSAYAKGYRVAQRQAECIRLTQPDGDSVALDAEIDIVVGSIETPTEFPIRLGAAARERLMAAGVPAELAGLSFRSLSDGDRVRARGTLRMSERADESGYRGARRDYALVTPLSVAFLGDPKRR